MTFGGRLGVEVDGIHERFQSSGLFDERFDQNLSIEDLLDTDPIVSRTTTTFGLLEAQLESGGFGPGHFLLSNTARLSTNRSRNTFRSEAGYRGSTDRLRIESQWNAQGGKDEPAAGSSAYVTGTWDRTKLPLGFGSQIRLTADWSHTTEEDLAPILESRMFRGHAELRRMLGSNLELRGLFGHRHKDALGSNIGSYSAWFEEGELSGGFTGKDRALATIRTEQREYVADTLGIPSSRTVESSVRYERSVGLGLRPYTEHEIEWQDYRQASDIFQDSHGWTGELGTDLFWNALTGDRAEGPDLFGPDLRLRLGGRYEIFRAGGESSDSLFFDSTFDSFGGLLGIAREGSDRFWFDLEFEAGRREYRNSAGSGSLVFEGLNFSLASSDYTYLRSSLVLDWLPARWIKAEAFVQWDQELHDVDADDFRLWMVNASISYPF